VPERITRASPGGNSPPGPLAIRHHIRETRTKLPAFYRRFMRDYPRWLAETQPDWSDVERWELADDPDRVISFNR
jgi:hypothetical protein